MIYCLPKSTLNNKPPLAGISKLFKLSIIINNRMVNHPLLQVLPLALDFPGPLTSETPSLQCN